VRATGFVDSTSCADDKLAGIHAGHPAGFSSARPPLQRGPINGAHHRGTHSVRSGCATAKSPRREALASGPLSPASRGRGLGREGALHSPVRQAGWPSLWLLSLGHPRESSSRSAGGRKLLLRTHHLKQEHRAQGALLQKSNSKGIATEVAPTSEGVKRAGAIGLRLCSWLPLPRFAGERVGERGRSSLPCAAVSRGRSGREAGIDMDVDAFSLGQDARSKSPAPAHGLAGLLPGKRQAGWPSLWLLSLTPGILPYALRASFAVRMRILRMREHAKRKWLALRKECESFCCAPTFQSKSIAHKVRSYKKAKASRLKSLTQGARAPARRMPRRWRCWWRR